MSLQLHGTIDSARLAGGAEVVERLPESHEQCARTFTTLVSGAGSR